MRNVLFREGHPIEKLQRIADDCGGQYLLLIAGQTRPAVEFLEHGVLPMAPVHCFGRALRQRIAVERS